MSDEPKNDPKGEDPKPGDAPGDGEAKPDDGGDTPPKSGDGDPKDGPKFTQAELDAILKERLDRERAKAKAEADKARRKAEEAALEQNKEFEKLAGERGKALEETAAKVAELEAMAESLTKRADSAEEVLGKVLEAELKALRLDDAVKELLSGKSTVAQLDWIAKHKASLSKGPGGSPASPDGNEGGGLSEAERKQQTARTW